MSETGAPQGASAVAAAPARRSKVWAIITAVSGFLIGLVAIIRGIAFFLPAGLADCDDSDLQSSLRARIEEVSHVKLTSVTDIRTVTRSDKTATCQMHVAASDGSQALMTYRLDKTKDGTQFQVVEVK